MHALRSRLGLLATLALASLPALASAQAVGPEFQVNTYTTDRQSGPSVASDANGNFVVVWRSQGQDGSFSGIFGQRHDSSGGAQGTEFQVNSYTGGYQQFPSVAAAANGGFVVVWESGYNQDGFNEGIFGQRYDAGGVAQGGEFLVNTYTTFGQRFPSVASDAAGNLVVVWGSRIQDGNGFGVFAQRYDSAGVAQGSEFRVNSFTPGDQDFPSVASDASGNFIVVWDSLLQDGDGWGVFGQRYDSTGVAQGDEFQVNSFTTGSQAQSSVASDESGNFVVVWASLGQDGDNYGIFGQRYDSAGAPQGGEFQVNTFTTSYQYLPSVASDGGGNFVVAWNSNIQDGSARGIFGQRYDSAGVAQGAEFQINSFTTANQRFPSVAATAPNQFVVTWDSFSQDGSDFGIFGQRYDFSDTTPPSVMATSPNGGEKVFTGSSYLVQWTASDDKALSSFDVSVSVDGGGSFTPIAECQDLLGSATSCLWLTPGPLSNTALIRVEAVDTSGNVASDDSDGIFRIVSGAGSVTVASPNTNVKWRIGSLQTIKWTHNLGLHATFRVELDRDNDGTYEELIAAAAPATTTTKGSFAWTVTGPPAGTARLRVSWTGSPAVSDASDVTFQIRPAALDATAEAFTITP